MLFVGSGFSRTWHLQQPLVIDGGFFKKPKDSRLSKARWRKCDDRVPARRVGGSARQRREVHRGGPQGPLRSRRQDSAARKAGDASLARLRSANRRPTYQPLQFGQLHLDCARGRRASRNVPPNRSRPNRIPRHSARWQVSANAKNGGTALSYLSSIAVGATCRSATRTSPGSSGCARTPGRMGRARDGATVGKPAIRAKLSGHAPRRSWSGARGV
jgi:hypothetical protein